jgi:glycogen synthase
MSQEFAWEAAAEKYEQLYAGLADEKVSRAA